MFICAEVCSSFFVLGFGFFGKEEEAVFWDVGEYGRFNDISQFHRYSRDLVTIMRKIGLILSDFRILTYNIIGENYNDHVGLNCSKNICICYIYSIVFTVELSE